MKNNICHIIISYCFLIILIISLIIASLNNSFIIEIIYQNIAVFILFLILSNNLIFNFSDKLSNNTDYFHFILRRLLIINFLTVLIFTISNIIILNIFHVNINYQKILIFSIQKFIILNVIALFNSIFYFKNRSIKSTENYANYIFLFLVSYIYIFGSAYHQGFLFINLFKYYFIATDFYTLFFHYLIWISIPIFIIDYKYLKKTKKEGNVNVRNKEHI